MFVNVNVKPEMEKRNEDFDGVLLKPKVFTFEESPLPPMSNFSVCYNSKSGEIYVLGGVARPNSPDLKNNRNNQDNSLGRRRRLIKRRFHEITPSLSSIWSFNMNDRRWKLLTIRLPEERHDGKINYCENQNTAIYYIGSKPKAYYFQCGDWAFPEGLELFEINFGEMRSRRILLSGNVLSKKNLSVNFAEMDEKSVLFVSGREYVPVNTRRVNPPPVISFPFKNLEFRIFEIMDLSERKMKIDTKPENLLDHEIICRCVRGRLLYLIVIQERKYITEGNKLTLLQLDFGTMEWSVISETNRSIFDVFSEREECWMKYHNSKILCYKFKHLVVFDTRSKVWNRFTFSFRIGFEIFLDFKGPLVIGNSLFFIREDVFGKDKNRNEMIIFFDLTKCFFGDKALEDRTERKEYLCNLLCESELIENDLKLDFFKIQIDGKNESVFVLKFLLC